MAKRFCLRPWCRVLVSGGYCHTHQPARVEPPWRQWYFTSRWRALRAAVLRRTRSCPGRGDGRPCGLPTTDVDHRTPHRGDPILFWDPMNLDAYCHPCHAAKTGRGL